MPSQMKSPALTGIGNGAEKDAQCRSEINGASASDNAALREALLTEFRCAALRSELAVTNLASVSVALRSGCITTPEAVALLEGLDAFEWLAKKIAT